MTVLATVTAVISARYFTLDPGLFLSRQRAVYVANLVPVLFHVGGGVLALALGPWQFVPRLRARHRTLHRVLGRIYLVAVLVAGAGGLLLVPKGLYWPVAPLGFAGLALALLYPSGMAFATIRRREITEHRIWMIRSYSLIFAAVTFRLWMAVLISVDVPYDQAYMSGAWLSWPLDLLVAQRLIARIRSRRPVAARAQRGTRSDHRADR
jgi:uncharacterized membrane protein